MVLKVQTDYALRTLIYLAHIKGQTSVESISTAYRISKDHLVKVVQQLVRFGYVVSKAGRNGGIRLAKDPAQIRCGKVVADFEGRNGLLPCVNDRTYCVLEPGCMLRDVLIVAEEAMYQALEKMSIADLLRANEPNKHGGIYNLTIRGQTAATQSSPSPDIDGETATEPKDLLQR